MLPLLSRSPLAAVLHGKGFNKPMRPPPGRAVANALRPISNSPQQLPPNQRIKEAGTCKQGLQLVQEAGKPGVMELTTAFNQMGRLHDGCLQRQASIAQLAANCHAFSTLLELAFKRLSSFDLFACAQLVWAAARLQVPLSAAQQAAWERRAEAQLKRGRVMPQSIGNIFWAFGKLELLPTSSGTGSGGSHGGTGSRAGSSSRPHKQLISRSFANALELAVERHATVMEPQHVSNTIHACGISSWKLGGAALAALQEAWLQQLLATAQQQTQLPAGQRAGTRWQHAATMKPQELSNSLWGWSKLGWLFDEQLQSAAAAAIAETAAAMNAQEVSNTIYACSVSGWKLGKAARTALRDALLKHLQATLEHFQQMPAGQHATTGQQLAAAMEPQHVANSLWGWARLGQQLDGDLAAVADAALLRMLPSMNGMDITQIQQEYNTEGWQLSPVAATALQEAAQRVKLTPPAAA